MSPAGFGGVKSWYNPKKRTFCLYQRWYKLHVLPPQPSTRPEREVRAMIVEEIVILALKAVAGVIEEVIRKK